MTDATPASLTEMSHGLLCPVCRIDLVMSERQGVEIDYCPKCRGVWLDRGELDKIIERGAQAGRAAPSTRTGPPSEPANPRAASGDEREGHHHHGGHHGHRRGWLGEIFD
jgi:Zn-finger nucleic acid-binding protein